MPTSPMIALILEQLLQILSQGQAEAYFVGGCVRDLLLGRPLHDLDLVVAGDAIALARTIARAFHAAFVLLDEENGIARVVLRGSDGVPGDTVDLARMRGASLHQDLAVRDLTVNAMAMHPAAFRRLALGEATQAEVIDPWGGGADLRAGLIRALSPQVLYEDPLRTMRVVRFAAELDFAVAPETAGWVRRAAGLLPGVSVERIRDELARLLACAHAAPFLPLLESLALLPQVLPEVEAIAGQKAPAPLWERVAALEWMAEFLAGEPSPQRQEALWKPAALRAHPDLALPFSFAVPLRRYLGERLAAERTRLVLLKLAALLAHGRSSAALARQAGQRLRLSVRETLALETAVGLSARLPTGSPWETSPRSIYRFFREGGDMAPGAVLLSLAIEMARAGPALEPAAWEERCRQAGAILAPRFTGPAGMIDPPRLLDGSDLMRALALPPGPLIGDLLEDIREAQAAGEIRHRDEALAWARRALERQG